MMNKTRMWDMKCGYIDDGSMIDNRIRSEKHYSTVDSVDGPTLADTVYGL